MMALPANTSTVTVAGTFLNPDGDPATGTITFTPSSWLTNSVDNITIPAATVTKTLGTAGNFTAVLPVTDDPDLSPNGWRYEVSEVIDGVSRRYDVLVPGSAATGGTVWLADLAPAVPEGPAYYSLASSLTIGTVTSLAPGGTATASITGLAPNQLLNLGVPAGPAASVTVGTIGTVAYPGPGTVTNSGTSGSAVLDFILVTGQQGPANTLTVGTVTTLAAGSAATATITGTSPNQVLNLGIPQGVEGTLSAAGLAAAGSAISAAGSASASAGSASSSASASAASAGSAASSASAAAASAGSAAVSASASLASAGSASTSASSASASASLAQDWAIKTSSPVAGSDFGAKKYAQDAQAAYNLAAALTNVDGGAPDSTYGGIGTIDAGEIA